MSLRTAATYAPQNYCSTPSVKSVRALWYAATFTFHILLELLLYYCIDDSNRVAQRVERWTCDQHVVSLNPTRGKAA